MSVSHHMRRWAPAYLAGIVGAAAIITTVIVTARDSTPDSTAAPTAAARVVDVNDFIRDVYDTCLPDSRPSGGDTLQERLDVRRARSQARIDFELCLNDPIQPRYQGVTFMSWGEAVSQNEAYKMMRERLLSGDK